MPELAGPVWEIAIPVLGQTAFEGATETAGPFVVFPKS
jgi:hypothetical protein